LLVHLLPLSGFLSPIANLFDFHVFCSLAL
jgi:hypothetical protein